MSSTKVSKSQLNPLARVSWPNLGTDPELFLANPKGIIGAEKVIPQEGVGGDALMGTPSPIVLDGVQLELHPTAHSCRQVVAANLQALFAALADKLASIKDVKASFDPVVTVAKAEFDTLSDSAKTLGCMPSFNGRDSKATVKVAKKHQRLRSAGGHLHFGLTEHNLRDRAHANKTDTRNLVDLFDILVGLPSVLIDRDPQQRTRRLIYGRANEYRLPGHGIEYRTPSNFWLRNYALFSWIMAQGRQAINIWAFSDPEFVKSYNRDGMVKSSDLTTELLSRVNMKQVVKAINRNDVDLAMPQWNLVKEFIAEYIPGTYGSGITARNLAQWGAFVADVQTRGLDKVFPTDPMTHWCSPNCRQVGFERLMEDYAGARALAKAA